jgi:hypothetical protein
MGNSYSLDYSEYPITIREDHWLKDQNDTRDEHYEIAEMMKEDVEDLDFSEKIYTYMYDNNNNKKLDTIYSICSILKYTYRRDFNRNINPSVLFLYSQIKILYKDFPNYKGPISIRDVFKIIQNIVYMKIFTNRLKKITLSDIHLIN